MKRFRVNLSIPTFLWAQVEVDADSAEVAEVVALGLAREGTVTDWEYGDHNTDETTIDTVDEVMEKETAQ